MPEVLAAEGSIGEPAINISIFGVFVLITLVITFRASRSNKSAADYYAAGRNISGQQNGLAIAGDYLSAASFLGIAGAIAVYGYDGFLYSIGFLVAWLVALLLVAELMRNTARFTMADVLAFRMRQGPVRMAAAISTLTVSLFYLLAQMAGAGGLVTLLLGVSGEAAQAVVVVIVGALMIFYVLVGGMRGTTYVQIIKASLLIIGALRDDGLGARQVRLQPVRAARRRRGERRGGPRRPRAGGAVRRDGDVEARLRLPGARAGARHRRPAARADALLHGAHGQGRPPLGRLGDLADRHLLPVQPGDRVRRRRAGRGRRDPHGAGCGQRCRAAAGLRARRHRAAGHHLGGRVRHDPRRRRGPHHHRVGVLRPRRVRQRDQEGAGAAERRGAGRARSPPSSSAPSRSGWASWRCRPA